MNERSIRNVLKEIEKTVNANWVIGKKDPFRVLVTTVLSQRTRDENTLRASERLFSKYSTPEEIARADIEDIEKLIKPSGFYRVKARKVKEISKEILERFGGRVPESLEDLLSLPGVGRKTANCVIVYGFGKPAIPVDTHVHRISNRLGLVRTKTPEETEKELLRIVPKNLWIRLNELFVKFGQRICRPVRPLCKSCPVRKFCKYGKVKG